MELEDDCHHLSSECVTVTESARRESSGALPTDLVFFRPVDGNMSYHNVMGEPLNHFDFIIQVLVPLSADFEHGVLQGVTLTATGATMVCRLSGLTYSDLSAKLLLWKSSGTGYDVAVRM